MKSIWGCIVFFIILGVCSMKVSASRLVVLDPGHGGENKGAEYLVETNSDILEKELTLIFARMVEEKLEQRGIAACLTRESDTDVLLKERAEFARERQGCMLVCLHFNASEDHQSYGSELWVPSEGEFYEEAFKLALRLEERLMDAGLNSRGIKVRLNDRGTDYYGILRECSQRDIMAVLVEYCYVDNDRDERFWREDASLEALAEATAQGIEDYLEPEAASVEYPVYYQGNKGAAMQDEKWRAEPDVTPPEWKRTAFEKGAGDTWTFTLQAQDLESRLSYYTYSTDQGKSWSQRMPWEDGENCTVQLELDDSVTEICFQVYNGYDQYAQSETLQLLPPENVQEETEEAPEIHEELREEGSKLMGWGFPFAAAGGAAVILLILLAFRRIRR